MGQNLDVARLSPRSPRTTPRGSLKSLLKREDYTSEQSENAADIKIFQDIFVRTSKSKEEDAKFFENPKFVEFLQKSTSEYETQHELLRNLPQVVTKRGTYRIFNILGQGSYGAIYLVRDTKSNQFYAMKVLKTGNRGAFERFYEKFERFENKNVVKTRDIAYLETNPTEPNEVGGDGVVWVCLVVDYIRGVSLSNILKWCDDVNVRYTKIFSVVLFMRVLRILRELEEAELFHGDIKPDNILWDGAKFVVCDFGFSDIRLKYDFCRSIVKNDYYNLGLLFYQVHFGVTNRKLEESIDKLIVELYRNKRWKKEYCKFHKIDEFVQAEATKFKIIQFFIYFRIIEKKVISKRLHIDDNVKQIISILIYNESGLSFLDIESLTVIRVWKHLLYDEPFDFSETGDMEVCKATLTFLRICKDKFRDINIFKKCLKILRTYSIEKLSSRDIKKIIGYMFKFGIDSKEIFLILSTILKANPILYIKKISIGIRSFCFPFLKSLIVKNDKDIYKLVQLLIEYCMSLRLLLLEECLSYFKRDPSSLACLIQHIKSEAVLKSIISNKPEILLSPKIRWEEHYLWNKSKGIKRIFVKSLFKLLKKNIGKVDVVESIMKIILYHSCRLKSTHILSSLPYQYKTNPSKGIIGDELNQNEQIVVKSNTKYNFISKHPICVFKEKSVYADKRIIGYFELYIDESGINNNLEIGVYTESNKYYINSSGEFFKNEQKVDVNNNELHFEVNRVCVNEKGNLFFINNNVCSVFAIDLDLKNDTQVYSYVAANNKNLCCSLNFDGEYFFKFHNTRKEVKNGPIEVIKKNKNLISSVESKYPNNSAIGNVVETLRDCVKRKNVFCDSVLLLKKKKKVRKGSMFVQRKKSRRSSSNPSLNFDNQFIITI